VTFTRKNEIADDFARLIFIAKSFFLLSFSLLAVTNADMYVLLFPSIRDINAVISKQW